jgi:hypothetical protein
MSRRTFGQYIHDKLQEPEGAQFVHGKFRFWLPAVLFLSVLNAILTALIFRADDGNYTGAIMLSVGALLCWLCVGCLHYSDSTDRRLARGVSALDSVTLLFVAAHFCALLYVYGHAATLRSAEAKYEREAARYNAEAKQVSTDNVEIARSAERVAQEATKRARLDNDAAYQLRKAAEAGRGLPRPASPSTPQPATVPAPALATSTVELEKPARPAESSAAFLSAWDAAIRLLNFGELLLAVLTLIFIRNQSAKTNSPTTEAAYIPLASTSARTPAPSPAFRKTHVSYEQEKTPKTHVSFDPEGLKRLRETLKDISFRLRGLSFKVDVKDDAAWIRMMAANNSTQETVASAKAKLSILDDALKMPRDAFRKRLERFLQQNGFDL